MTKMKIGVTANILLNDSGYFAGEMKCIVSRDYLLSLEKAGAIVVVLPVMKEREDIRQQLQGLDGIVVSGGADIDPHFYGESVHGGCGPLIPEVDQYDIEVFHLAEEMHIPVLGICKGIQAMNVAFGGTLYQDLLTEREGSYQHTQKTYRNYPTHDLYVEKDSFLYPVLSSRCRVNSFHHQAVRDVANGFRVIARSEEGVIEGIQKEEGSFMVGVQFHPEMMAQADNTTMLHLFRAFLTECEKNKVVKKG